MLLAAGEGRRLGRPKALVRLRGRLLVERGLLLLRESHLRPVVVVLGAAAEEVRSAADLEGVTVVVNHAWPSGMGSSFASGLRALEASDAAAAVIALVDQPGVTPPAVRRLVDAWRDGAEIAVATYGGSPRNPVLIGREHWSRAAEAATGDRGARAFLRAHDHLVTPVPCDDVATPEDLDTPADLAAAEAAGSDPAPSR